MNPLMCQLLSTSDFVEADITFNESLEYPYLFNVVAFDKVTMEWTIVSRIREWTNKMLMLMLLHLRRQLMHANKIIQTIMLEKHWLVWLLTGVTQRYILGLGLAVGKDLVTNLLCGCKVHWARSWQRVRDRVPKSFDKSREKAVFSKIASKLLKSREVRRFKAPCGEIKLVSVLEVILDLNKVDAEYVDRQCDWTSAKHWASW